MTAASGGFQSNPRCATFRLPTETSLLDRTDEPGSHQDRRTILVRLDAGETQLRNADIAGNGGNGAT